MRSEETSFPVETSQGSEAEWSCLNTGDGCNRIVGLNDGQRGEHAITSSQPVHQSEAEEENRSNASELRLRAAGG